MATTAEPVAAVVPKTDENLIHTDVMLFNRWSYDDVSVILLVITISLQFAKPYQLWFLMMYQLNIETLCGNLSSFL